MNWGDMLTTTIENDPQRGQGGGRRRSGSGVGVVAGACVFLSPCPGFRRLTIQPAAYHDVS